MHKPARNRGVDMARHATAMRERAMSVAMKRKEDYLGARVSRELKDRVIARADEMGIPVSLLIRKVLEEAFLGMAQNPSPVALAGGAPPQAMSSDARYADILAWKGIEINKAQQCERCGTPLPAGSEAVLGILSSDGDTAILCRSCKDQLRRV